MSPARVRAGRGTWKAVATVLAALAVPATGVARVAEAPVVVRKPAVKPARSDKPAKPDGAATIEDLIRETFGKRSDEALRVASCESKLDPKALSRAGARGVFQIMPVHTWRVAQVGGTNLDDPKTNVRVAKALFDDEGWRPWTCARIVGAR
jgi:soluble lytic murein transglycosylase-like protein